MTVSLVGTHDVSVVLVGTVDVFVGSGTSGMPLLPWALWITYT